MMNRNFEHQEHCTQCPRHCAKDQLRCGRGRAAFGEKAMDSQEMQNLHMEHGDGDRKNKYGKNMERKKCRHGEWQHFGSKLKEDCWENQELAMLLGRCGHIAIHKYEKNERLEKRKKKSEASEDMFAVLSDEEQSSLRMILKKLLEKWNMDRVKHDK